MPLPQAWSSLVADVTEGKENAPMEAETSFRQKDLGWRRAVNACDWAALGK